jgi:uncharacterized protein (DUF1330 family)
VANHTAPDLEQLAGLGRAASQGPIHMLNLLRFREEARYPDGRVMRGGDAYRVYQRASREPFERVGGKLLWSGAFVGVVIGPADERWDLAFVAVYPSLAAFQAMLADPGYRQAVEHRQAAVEDSRLIQLTPG